MSPTTIKGLIYYLKVPKDKAGQEKRFREVIAQKNSYMQKYQSKYDNIDRIEREAEVRVHTAVSFEEKENGGPSAQVIGECLAVKARGGWSGKIENQKMIQINFYLSN